MKKLKRAELLAIAASMCCALVFQTAGAAAAPVADELRTGYVQDTTVNPFIVTGTGGELGDPFPVYMDGVWHLYAMAAGSGSVPHFTSTDLVKWVEHKPAMVGNGICTGTVLRHDKTYYLFYTDGGPQTIHLVTSDNPWEFDFSKSRLVAEGDGKIYQKSWFRDVYVFYNESEKLWWMLIESRGPDVCVGLFKSKDLLDWTPSAPIFKDKARQYGSCPQIFQHDNLWYLALQDMGNCYYSATDPRGPWTHRGEYLSLMAEAASRFATDGKRQITWGWLCDWIEKPKKSIGRYGGPLCVGREVVFKKDGTLGMRAFPELIAAIRGKGNDLDLPVCANPVSGEWKIEKREAVISGDKGGVLLLNLPTTNPNYYFETDLKLDSARTIVNIGVRVSAQGDHGYCLVLNPAAGKVEVRQGKPADALLNEIPYNFPAATTRLQIFVFDNHMEVFLDDQACVTSRIPEKTEHRISIEASGGGATVIKPMLHYFGK